MSEKEIDKIYRALGKLTKTVEEMKANQKAHEDKTEPMYEWFTHMTWAKKTAVWFFTLLGAAAGAALTIKEFLMK